MGQSRDAQRLQQLANARVRAAILVDRPKGFARAKDRRLGAGAEADGANPSPVARAFQARLAPEAEDHAISARLGDGVYLGATSHDLVVADRSRLSGRPKSIIRRAPMTTTRVRWLDEERHGMRSRFLVIEFADDRWALLATPWKRLVPDDAQRLVDALGVHAHRVPHPEVDDLPR